jgi:hypothetical protein
MVYLGHVKNDVEVAKWDNKVTFLCSVSKGTFPLASGEGILGDMDGCYLFHYRPEILYEVARFSVPADPFMARYKEHNDHATTNEGMI